MFGLFANPILLLAYTLALVAAITVHEFAHALVADRLGDPTPRLQGRLTLNPLAHLDPIGTLMLFLVRFGWGKPVQFDPFNLRNPRRDAALISIAGPISNLATAALAALILQFLSPPQLNALVPGPALSNAVTPMLGTLLTTFIYLSTILAVFNLVPVHPLDGFKIVGGLLSQSKAREWYQLERYGMIFLLLLIFPILSTTPPIQLIISPVINAILSVLLPQTPLI